MIFVCNKYFLYIFVTALCLPLHCESFNKYTEQYNQPGAQGSTTGEKPFRMQKLNIIWEKAQKRLPEQKLKLLHSDLVFQDKEELALKKLKGEGSDKSGLKEAMVQGSLSAILKKYDLMDDFQSVLDTVTTPDPQYTSSYDSYGSYPGGSPYKMLFRDKKLNKLWHKAEQAGLSSAELSALKEEFDHHQTKIDQYYQLMDQVNRGSWFLDQPANSIEKFLEAEEGDEPSWKKLKNPHQELREKHDELRQGYNFLTGKILSNVPNFEFEEPQVASLWEMAQKSNFSPVELESLKGELHHFQHRIRKLKSIAASLDIHRGDKLNFMDNDLYKKEKKLKEYNYKVDKHHRELASRILERHSEL